jgi:hypothetical protein
LTGNKSYQEYWIAKDILRHIPKWAFVYYRGTGSFPRPIKSSVGKMRWKKEAVERWIERYEMEGRKRWKFIDPAIRIFEEVETGNYALVPPAKGLALDCEGVYSHAYMFTPDELPKLGGTIRVVQCPDYPRCSTCQDYDFNLRGWMQTCEEIIR